MSPWGPEGARGLGALTAASCHWASVKTGAMSFLSTHCCNCGDEPGAQISQAVFRPQTIRNLV